MYSYMLVLYVIDSERQVLASEMLDWYPNIVRHRYQSGYLLPSR
jgi:hypothetical protein